MPYRADARLAGRHPFEVFTLYLAFLTGLPTVLDLAPRPGSVDAELPLAVAVGWSFVLTLGAMLALMGIYWKDRITGLIMEQLGIGFVGVAAAIYVGTALYAIGWAAAIPGAVLGGFALSCGWRYRQIQRTLNIAKIEQQANQAVRRLEAKAKRQRGGFQ